MWKKLLQHFDNKRCIANANEFLHSSNRVLDHKMRQLQQSEHDRKYQQQAPYTAREQQFRYPRQPPVGLAINYRQQVGNGNGRHHSSQVLQPNSLRP